MNRHIAPKRPWHPGAALLILLILATATTGCRHLKEPLGHTPETSEASAVYALACTGMASAKTTDEFFAALSAMDQRTGLDFSGEDPAPLIRALRHGAALMETANSAAGKKAARYRSNQKQLTQKIKTLEKEVATLKHQISVLENIDQERREKRKAQ